jgi:thiol-disulfide isomerase/thioredoxin
MKRVIASALAIGMMFSLSACGSDPLADQFRNGDNKNYISGDGSVTEFNGTKSVGEKWTSTTFDGQALSSDSLLGHVTVLNFWYAGCAPCRAETPDLAAIADEYEEKGVYVVGVNVRDTAATALAFARTHKLNYPSVMDIESGAVVQAYTGVVSPSAVPTTLVINAKGEVTSRVLGRFEPGTLRSLIDTALKG